METFKQIPNYEGFYEVSTLGNVRSIDREIPGSNAKQKHRTVKAKVMTKRTDRRGYVNVTLCANGKTSHHRVHRLVMLTFSPNDNSCSLDVNHINGNKLDNRIENLEWATRSANHVHRYRVLGQKHSMVGKFGGKHHRSIKVVGINELGETVCSFESLMDAQRAGYCASQISNCISGKRNSHAGLKWSAPGLRNFV